MADEEKRERRPLWVRLMVLEMKRPAALVVVSILGLLAGINLLLVAIESASGSILGAISFPIVLLGACVCTACGIWCWLAVRWVDRNDTWG
jgi:hypothetical protein